MILAGKGTKHARESLLALAEHIGAPIVLTLPAKGIIPDEHPLCIGGLGLIGTKPSYEAMKHADTLIMVGTSIRSPASYLKSKTIHIDTDPAQIGKRYATDIGLAGDADKTLRWLIENVEEHTDHSFLEHHQEMMKSGKKITRSRRRLFHSN